MVSTAEANVKDLLPRSMKNLWTLLSGSLNLKSLQFIADELEQSQTQLLQGVLFYRPHDVVKNSEAELAKRTHGIIRPKVLHQLSVFLDLDADQCYQLFQSYLLNEYKGTPEMVKSLFSSEKAMRELFEDLWYYYYSERLFTLFCCKQILSNWKTTNDHIYGKIFRDFLKHTNSDNQLLVKLIEQLRNVIQWSEKKISRSKYGNYFTEKLSIELHEHMIKEQIEIVQLLLLYYKNFEPTCDNVLELLRLFAQTGFSTKLPISSTTIESGQTFLAFLKALLIVECLDPNYLYKCHSDAIEHFLLKPANEKFIRDISSVIVSLNTSFTEHSPIFLCWVIVSLLENVDQSEGVERFGVAALELKIFKYFERCIKLPQMVLLKGSFVYELIFEIVGNLLAVTFTTFDLEKLLSNEPSLTHLLILIFANDTVARLVFDSSLASGLGLALRYALDQFPFKTHFLLNLLHSLSRTASCKEIFESMSILNTLTTFTELFDSSSLNNFTPLDADKVMLTTDKPVLKDCHKLLLPKGTKGTIFHLNGNRMVRWHSFSIDGWKFLYFRLKYLIEQIKQGQMYAAMLNDEVVLYEMSTVAYITAELIAHGAHHSVSHFKLIVNLLLEAYKLMVNFSQTSIRLFMAGVIYLCATIMKHGYLPADQIWFSLTEKKFLPYMIGFSTQFAEILAGTDTNISTLGYILSTDEFIKGSYELTFAFLEFISQCAKRNQFLSENVIVASFIFIIKDIFPSYRLWNYKNEYDSSRIGRMCIDIFYNLLNRARKNPPEKMEKIERICTILLMESSSAEYLLHIIKHGETTVKHKVLNSGNDSLLVTNDQIVGVRTALLVLSYLLELYSHATKGQKSKSVIEELLFSSTTTGSSIVGHSSTSASSNMLLTITYFVYQKYDIYLATNAMQLLSELAYKFPMSMLACFGSHTESIRDHFLFRLETLTEDINFKISLLNFLSICVEHQPGLAEMFLNASTSTTSGGVLGSILEILEEKLEGEYFCPLELHQASLQFLVKFWLQPNMIAMNLLKKNENFWKLITFPLFIKTDEQFNNSLCSYILKILSREMFYSKMLETTEESSAPKLTITITAISGLDTICDQLENESVIERLATHIHQRIIGSLQIDSDSSQLIDAWKDFFSSWTMFERPIPDSVNGQVVSSLLEGLSVLINNNNTPDMKYTKTINKLSNILLIISNNWQSSTVQVFCEQYNFVENICKLFHSVAQNRDVISFSALISLYSSLLKVILLCLDKFTSQVRLFEFVCQLLYSTIQLTNKELSTNSKCNLMLEKRLINVLLCTVVVMIDVKERKDSHRNKYWTVLRRYEISGLVFNLFIYLVHHKLHLDLAHNLPLYFVTLSSTTEGADLLYNLNLFNNVAIYFRPPPALFGSKQEDIEHSYIKSIFAMMMRTVIYMTIQLRHHFVESCISFVAIYSDVFQQLFATFRQSRQMKYAGMVLISVKLCSTLSKYIKTWQQSHPQSLDLIAKEVLLTTNSVIAFLLRPTMLNQPSTVLTGGATAATSEVSGQSGSSFKSITSGVKFASAGGGSMEQQSNEDNSYTVLSKILLYSFKFITDISPDLFDLFELCDTDPVNDQAKANALVLGSNFSMPNPDSIESLTFGSLLNYINYIIKCIYKLEKDVSVQLKDSKSVQIIQNIELDITLLEYSLTILLNQTLIAKNSSQINQVDKQIFFREINNEVNTIKSNLASKPQRRANSTSLSLLSTPSPIKNVQVLNLMERQYVQLFVKLIDNVIQ